MIAFCAFFRPPLRTGCQPGAYVANLMNCRPAALAGVRRSPYDGRQRAFTKSRRSDRRQLMVNSETTTPVGDAALTRASLLVQIRDGTNQPAWQEFMRLYGPIVYGFARKRGLQDADAADLMQDVMRSVSGAIGRLEYDRSQGTFRGWLFTITRNKIFNFLSARRIRPQGSGDSTMQRLLDSQPDADDGSETWEVEYQRRLAALAIDRVKHEFQDHTWRAFQLAAVEGRPAAEVAEQLKMSTGAVYVSRSRVLARLKSEVETLRRQEEN